MDLHRLKITTWRYGIAQPSQTRLGIELHYKKTGRRLTFSQSPVSLKIILLY